MIEFILNILDILFNYPEGVSFALFSSVKKGKKAYKKVKKEIDKINTQLDPGQVPGADASLTGEQIFEDNQPINKKDVPYVPSFPYTGRQIIIDSGRVHLNAKDDFIILSSKKSIALSAVGSVNIDSDSSFVVNSNQIKLGISAEEPLVKGNTLLTGINSFTQILQALPLVLDDAVYDSAGGALPEVVEITAAIAKAAKVLEVSLRDSLSTKNFTE